MISFLVSHVPVPYLTRHTLSPHLATYSYISPLSPTIHHLLLSPLFLHNTQTIQTSLQSQSKPNPKSKPNHHKPLNTTSPKMSNFLQEGEQALNSVDGNQQQQSQGGSSGGGQQQSQGQGGSSGSSSSGGGGGGGGMEDTFVNKGQFVTFPPFFRFRFVGRVGDKEGYRGKG